MNIDAMQSFFMWCTIINFGLLLLWFVMFAYASDWIYRYHNKWFGMSRQAFNTAHYSGMGIFKLGICVFNLVPYIALLIIA